MVQPKKRPPTPPTLSRNLDPKSINSRLYNQVDALLTQLEEGEHITLKERIAALIAVGRMQVIFMGLRKETADDDGERGSTVRKYAGAFKADDPRERKTRPRPGPSPNADDDDLSDLIDDDREGMGDPDAA